VDHNAPDERTDFDRNTIPPGVPGSVDPKATEQKESPAVSGRNTQSKAKSDSIPSGSVEDILNREG